MLSKQCRRAILQILHKDGRVLVGGLAQRLHTSPITIRKDLEHLHQHGQLQRRHGGALPISAGVTRDSSLREKEQLRQGEKRRIARAAAQMIQSGQVIILDSGTTTTAIARACREIRNLTTITNATNIAVDLSDAALDVILTGGTLRKNSFSLVGTLAEESLRKLRADLLFLAVDGFDVSYGLTAPNLPAAHVNRVVAEAARRTIVVCDPSKFGSHSLSLILPTSAVHETITHKGIAKTDLAGLTTSLDTNDDPEDRWSGDILLLLKHVDIFLPNEREACKLAQATSVERAVEVLSPKVPILVIKRGPQGAIARTKDEKLTAFPPVVDMVDAVGAGDTFDAGFIHQFIRGAKVEDCLKYANVVAALSVTRAGGTEAFRDEASRRSFLTKNTPVRPPAGRMPSSH